MNFIAGYGLFLAKIATLVIAVMVLIAFVLSSRSRKKQLPGELSLTHPAEEYEKLQSTLQQALLEPAARKRWLKDQKKQQKYQRKHQTDPEKPRPVLFLLKFKGSMDAHQVSALRQEVSGVLSVAKPGDEVLLQLESPGGVVHGYGLAASQLRRFRDQGVRLTVVVDKVAASGGYMMACVADHIVAAPFAILGSIGVVAQVPNIHRLLKRNDIDIELHTAGQYKRTLTLLGENDQQGRQKFKQELNETHLLFKSFVKQMRPSLDIDAVATGEHWYGRQAISLGLIDEIATSDEVIIRKMADYRLLGVSYIRRKSLIERISNSGVTAAEHALLRLWQRGKRPLL